MINFVDELNPNIVSYVVQCGTGTTLVGVTSNRIAVCSLLFKQQKHTLITKVSVLGSVNII